MRQNDVLLHKRLFLSELVRVSCCKGRFFWNMIRLLNSIKIGEFVELFGNLRSYIEKLEKKEIILSKTIKS